MAEVVLVLSVSVGKQEGKGLPCTASRAYKSHVTLCKRVPNVAEARWLGKPSAQLTLS